MIVYRLTTGEFANDLSGMGSKIYGGRWNPVGIAALYTSEFISLAILEILVRATKKTSPYSYTLTSFDIPENSIYIVQLKKLKPEWKFDLKYTQGIGEDFLSENQTLCVKVPSAIVPQENNFLLNPLHPDFKRVKITGSELLELDKRLLV
ncbi:MAG TPA: RES family NAD+ phosphorylase [Hanamia sp.]|jgi:RES domain-containing protein|nr:RES family NAD+ phosphorylase [Hanamia sp.]